MVEVASPFPFTVALQVATMLSLRKRVSQRNKYSQPVLARLKEGAPSSREAVSFGEEATNIPGAYLPSMGHPCTLHQLWVCRRQP